MNKKIVQELFKQLQQENQDPKDIGKLNITNVPDDDYISARTNRCEKKIIKQNDEKSYS